MKFTVKKEESLLEIIKSEKGFSSNTKARNFIKNGNVEVSGKVNKIPSTLIKVGSDITVADGNRKKAISDAPYFPHEIIFEDETLLVVNKRTGMISKASNRKLRTLFSSASTYLKAKGEERPFLVNSVDKKESGLVVMAKDLMTLKTLEANWKSFHKRHYVVIPGGMLEADGELVDTFHENDIGLLLPGSGKVTHEVELKYRVMKSNGEFSVIRVDEISQSKNQIRAMFASLSNPIVGDKKYRSEHTFEKGMAAHFFSLDLELNGRELKLRTPIPKLFLRLAR